MGNYIFESVNGTHHLFSRDQIIANAIWQRDEQHITPMYCRDFGKHGRSEPGFLVASGMNGAIVCVLRDNGRHTIFQAWQGEFIVDMKGVQTA